jgi:hypothetical protein
MPGKSLFAPVRQRHLLQGSSVRLVSSRSQADCSGSGCSKRSSAAPESATGQLGITSRGQLSQVLT